MGGAFDFYNMPGLDMLEDVMMAFLAIYFAIAGIASVYSIVVYVLHSAGLYAIAKRRLIHKPWLAWVPLANLWVLGSISDHYQYMAKNKKTKRRKILVGLIIALYATVIAIAIALGVTVGMAAVTGALEQVLVPAVILVIGYVALIVLAIVFTVFQYIAYYDLFTSCNPDNAVIFLVLGIFFNFLLPYFVFACRKKDLGMPAPTQIVTPQSISEPEAVEADPAAPVAEERDFEPEE